MTGLAPVLAEGIFNDPALLFCLLVAGIVIVVFVLRRRAAMQKRAADSPVEKAAAREELRKGMDELLVELQETSRDINAMIDTKTAVLNKLIEDADRRIEALKALENKPPSGQAGMPVLQNTEEAARRVAQEREILRLADSGKTDLEIARLTGVPRGEVELVLSLRRLPGAEGGPSR